MFGLIPSPEILLTLIEHYLKSKINEHPEIDLLMEVLYIKVLIAVKLYKNSHKVMEKGKCLSQKWASNRGCLRAGCAGSATNKKKSTTLTICALRAEKFQDSSVNIASVP